MRIGELSRRVQVSADLLRVWERRYGLLQPRRTRGGTRLYSALDQSRVKLMKRYLAEGMPASQASEHALSARLSIRPGQQVSVISHEAETTAARMRAALERFDETAAEHALQQLLALYTATAVTRDVILPYLHEIGERWANQHMNVAQEHFASNFLQSRLLALARGWDHALGPRALLACSPGDYHTLALIAFGIALHRLGWKITYLGAATPIEMIETASQQVAPALVVVSCELSGCLDRQVSAVRKVANTCRLAIAGSATDLELAESCEAEWLADDPITAAYALAASAGGREGGGLARAEPRG
jgi:DNA-binding transcriptional MerR regulator